MLFLILACGATVDTVDSGRSQPAAVVLRHIEVDCDTAAGGFDVPGLETSVWQLAICSASGDLCVPQSHALAVPADVSYVEGDDVLRVDCGSGWLGADRVVLQQLVVQ